MEIKNSTKSKNCIEIAQNILSNYTNENISMLEYLDSISLQKLKVIIIIYRLL